MIALKIAAVWLVAAVSFCALWTAAHGGWQPDADKTAVPDLSNLEFSCDCAESHTQQEHLAAWAASPRGRAFMRRAGRRHMREEALR